MQVNLSYELEDDIFIYEINKIKNIQVHNNSFEGFYDTC